MTRLSFSFLLAFNLYSGVFSVPYEQHTSGGIEHIVLIDNDHPATPHPTAVLHRLSLHANHPDVRHVFSNSKFSGFAASMNSHCLNLLADMNDVASVERTISISTASPIKRDAFPYDTRLGSPWGLERISTADNMQGSAIDMNYMYTYDQNTSLGQNADIYILDTGIFTQHQAFSGRAKMLWSFNGNMEDLDGHGTHVSGTASGDVFGVASNANVLGIKALDSSGGGWSSDVIAGIDYVIQRHDLRLAASSNTPFTNTTFPSTSPNPAVPITVADFSLPDTPFIGSVLSMSLASSGAVPAINAAVAAAVSAGIHVVAAAGNDGTSACLSSPASAGGSNSTIGAITVGAVDITATRPSFSNTGPCVDLYAPGVDILSAWPPLTHTTFSNGTSISTLTPDGATNLINLLDGTSMSTPHVAGIVACAMAVNASLARDPAAMKAWLVGAAALPLADGTRLANNGVRADVGDGLLGLRKVRAGEERWWDMAEQ